MASTLNVDTKRSRKSTAAYLEPLMKHFGWTFASTENHNNPAEAYLDRDCSIDAVIGKPNGTGYTEYIPCAHRAIETKPNGRHYNCFSFREDRASGNRTETQKLMDTSKPRPEWHIQTFIDTATNIATVAFARTSDLLQFVANHATEILKCHDGTIFRLVKWLDLLTAGIKVAVYKICAATGEVTKLSEDDLKGAKKNAWATI